MGETAKGFTTKGTERTEKAGQKSNRNRNPYHRDTETRRKEERTNNREL